MPYSGSYWNEADYYDPEFQHSFWGAAKYPKLLAVKQAYDPKGLFTCHHCVGSEFWDDAGNCPKPQQQCVDNGGNCTLPTASGVCRVVPGFIASPNGVETVQALARLSCTRVASTVRSHISQLIRTTNCAVRTGQSPVYR